MTMRLRKAGGALLIIAALGGALSERCGRASERDTALLRFARDVSLGEIDERRLVRVPFDEHVYRHTRDSFPDVRLQAADGRSVPFIVRRQMVVRKVPQQQQAELVVDSVKKLPENRLEVVLRLPKKLPEEARLEGLQLRTGLKSFERLVDVDGIRPDGRTEPLARGALIYDYSEFADVRDTTVRFSAASDVRRFRLVFHQVTEDAQTPLVELTRRQVGGKVVETIQTVQLRTRPFRLDGAALLTVVQKEERKPAEAEYPFRELTVREDPQSRTTVLQFESSRQPITAVQFETPAENFVRRVRVEAGESVTGYTPRGEGTIRRISYLSRLRDETTVTVSETRATHWRAVVFNEDSPPLTFTAVRGRGVVYELVFLAEPRVRYVLRYGAEAVGAPRFPEQEMLVEWSQRDDALLVGSLGKARMIENVPQPPPSFREVVENPWVSGPVLLMLLLALTVALAGAARRLRVSGEATGTAPGQPQASRDERSGQDTSPGQRGEATAREASTGADKADEPNG